MLEIRGLCAGYARADVLHGVDLEVRPGEIVALLGANGAGKSTLAKVVSGLLPTRAGSVTLDGLSLATLTPGERVRRGLVHVPEGRQVFGGLTVEENLLLGTHAKPARALAPRLDALRDAVCRTFPMLLDRLRMPAAALSGGQQQMLAIARGLMAEPRWLVLDEPSLGLSPSMVAEIFRLIGMLRGQGISILLSEQNAQQSLAVADRGYVIEAGRIVLHGTAKELLGSADVAAKYLGVGTDLLGGSTERRHAVATRLKAALAQCRAQRQGLS